MTDVPPIRAVIGLPPGATVAAFDARDDLRTTRRWSEMWHEDHARAFTVAKVAQVDLLATIRGSLRDVLANGGTFEQWKAGLVPELQKAGWWGQVDDEALTGVDHPVFVGGRRLRTIYDTNLRMSRAAGQWSRIQELKAVRPFLMYVSVRDNRTRPLHRRWGGNDPAMPIGIILPVDHPCWAIYYPPNDWHCRCTVRQLSQRDLDRNGWRVTTDAELTRLGWLDGSGQPGGRRRNFYRAGATTPVSVPAGVGPGFGYNPGIAREELRVGAAPAAASLAPVAEKAIRSLEDLAKVNVPAAQAAVAGMVRSAALDSLLAEPGTTVPIMVLDDRLRAAIGATERVVRLSADTYAKQQGKTGRSAGHPDLTLDDYRALPALGADPEQVYRQGDNRLLLTRGGNGRWRVAIVKVTGSGELYLVSYRWANARTIRQLLSAAEEVEL